MRSRQIERREESLADTSFENQGEGWHRSALHSVRLAIYMSVNKSLVGIYN